MALNHAMITPFSEATSGNGIISYGLTSYGYDIRISNRFKVFTNIYGASIDPKSVNTDAFMDLYTDDYITIPPNSFALGESIEVFTIPRNVLSIVLGKSTYARTGVIANFTPLEPAWSGTITIELSNSTPLPVKVYAGEGIAQVLFFESDTPCEISYADKKGKYQNQVGVTLPKVL
jgi:dCTP deaminase